jgi:hypothetical protein
MFSAADRFTDDEERLYYTPRGTGPFGPKGPSLPLDYVEGRRFSIHHRADCWSVEDLARASQYEHKVAFVTLYGPAFDDAALATIATFSHAHLLELDGVPVVGPGLVGLVRFPRLQFLRVRVSCVEHLSLHDLPVLEALESLELTGGPQRLSSVARLAEVLPKLRTLTLGSTGQTSSDGELVHEKLDELGLRFPNIPDWVGVPASLRSLSVRAPDATDADVKRLLAMCPDTLESLVLHGTPVSDAVLEHLERFKALRYIDARHTRITTDGLRRLASGRPRFKSWSKI